MKGSIRLVTREDVNEDRWNELINKSQYFRHYYLTYFLDAATHGWSAIICDDYEWVWPLPTKRFPVKQIIQPLLAQQLGPFPPDKVGKEDVSNICGKLSLDYWRLNFKLHDKVKIDLPSISHINIELQLNKPYEELSKAYNRNVQSNLKKARHTYLKISESSDYVNDLVDMFKSGKGKGIRELDHAFYETVKAIYEAFESRKQAQTWIARLDGQIVAGAMVFHSNDRLLLFFTASSQKSRSCGAMHAIIDAIIEHWAEKAQIFDFEGSDDPNLAFFYKSFGGVEEIYLQYKTKWKIPFLNRLFE
jgi:hypothetical protein